MAFTPYIQPQDQAAFDVADATLPQLSLASRIFDTFIGKPEGLLWTADANGVPAYMTNIAPTLSYAGITIPAGTNITVTLPGTFGYSSIGDVVTLDKGNPTLAETCIIALASGNTITLGNVQFGHSAGTVDFGMAISEEVKGRVRLSRSPVANIISASGRYNYGREMREISGGFDSFESLLATNYGNSDVSGWIPLDLTRWDVNNVTGAIRHPQYGHEDVRVRYIAGYQAAPDLVKQCVANITRTMIDADIPANVKSFKDGDAMITQFNSSLIDADTRAMAQSFKSMRI